MDGQGIQLRATTRASRASGINELATANRDSVQALITDCVKRETSEGGQNQLLKIDKVERWIDHIWKKKTGANQR